MNQSENSTRFDFKATCLMCFHYESVEIDLLKIYSFLRFSGDNLPPRRPKTTIYDASRRAHIDQIKGLALFPAKISTFFHWPLGLHQRQTAHLRKFSQCKSTLICQSTVITWSDLLNAFCLHESCQKVASIVES